MKLSLPLILLDLFSTNLYCVRAWAHCYICLYICHFPRQSCETFHRASWRPTHTHVLELLTTSLLFPCFFLTPCLSPIFLQVAIPAMTSLTHTHVLEQFTTSLLFPCFFLIPYLSPIFLHVAIPVMTSLTHTHVPLHMKE